MNIKYLLPKSAVQDVAAILFPYGRSIDWEMRGINQSSEELILTSTDLDLHKQVMQLCPLTTDYQRSRLRSAVDAAERERKRDRQHEAIMATIRSGSVLFDRTERAS